GDAASDGVCQPLRPRRGLFSIPDSPKGRSCVAGRWCSNCIPGTNAYPTDGGLCFRERRERPIVRLERGGRGPAAVVAGRGGAVGVAGDLGTLGSARRARAAL